MNPSLIANIFNDLDQLKTLTLEQWEQIILILRDSQVLAKFCYLVKSNSCFNSLPSYVQHHLNNAEAVAKKQENQIEYEAKELLKITEKSSKFSVFLKGAAYTLANKKAGKGRIYSDIDLVVSKASITTIEAHLSILGWLAKETNEYDQNYYREWAHEIPPMQHTNRGTVLDLHHNLVPPMSGRADNLGLLIQDSIELNGNIHVLSPAAMTLHSAIHLFFNEEFNNGFRDIHDLHLLFTEHNTDEFWKKIISLAESTQFEVELFLATRYCKSIFKTSVPDFVESKFKTLKQPIKLKYWDFIFSNVLLPHHPSVQTTKQKIAIFLALIRGHILKMPFGLLLKHTSHKLWKGLVESILGKSYFLKEDNKKG